MQGKAMDVTLDFPEPATKQRRWHPKEIVVQFDQVLGPER